MDTTTPFLRKIFNRVTQLSPVTPRQPLRVPPLPPFHLPLTMGTMSQFSPAPTPHSPGEEHRRALVALTALHRLAAYAAALAGAAASGATLDAKLARR